MFSFSLDFSFGDFHSKQTKHTRRNHGTEKKKHWHTTIGKTNSLKNQAGEDKNRRGKTRPDTKIKHTANPRPRWIEREGNPIPGHTVAYINQHTCHAAEHGGPQYRWWSWIHLVPAQKCPSQSRPRTCTSLSHIDLCMWCAVSTSSSKTQCVVWKWKPLARVLTRCGGLMCFWFGLALADTP